MGLSSFCLKHRKKEKRALKPFLAYGVFGSVLLHLLAGLGIAVSHQQNPETANDPIEVTLADTSKPEINKLEVEKVKPPESKLQPPVPPPKTQESDLTPQSQSINSSAPSSKPGSPRPNLNPGSPKPSGSNPGGGPQKLGVSQSSSTPSQGNLLTGTTGSGFGVGGSIGSGTGSGGMGGGGTGSGTGSGDGTGSGTGGSGNGSGTGGGDGTGSGTGGGRDLEPREGPTPPCISNCQLPKITNFPRDLKKQVKGPAIVKFVILKDGRVSAPQIVMSSGTNLLDQKALTHISKMRFARPEDGRDRIIKRFPFNFTIPNA